MKLLEISMVVALVVESRNSRQRRKTQQMSHSLPNSIHSQQETAHLTRPSWNQYGLSHQPNHLSTTSLSCTHAVQWEIHQSKTMAVLCLSLTFRARNQPLSNLLNYTRVQMAQIDGVRWAYELLFVACAQEAVTPRKSKSGFSDVQH